MQKKYIHKTRAFMKKHKIKDCGHAEMIIVDDSDCYRVLCSFCMRRNIYPKEKS